MEEQNVAQTARLNASAQWAPSVILVDADYLDRVAFDLIVNFERMIGRRIPEGDLCHWLDCVALDGGLEPGDNKVQAHFLHSKGKERLDNFNPSRFEADLNGLAYKDRLGDFSLFAFPVEEVVTMDKFFVESVQMLLEAKEVEQLMVVGDMDAYGVALKDACRHNKVKDLTLFAMEPLTGRGFQQEILGYSLMSALGIRSEELG